MMKLIAHVSRFSHPFAVSFEDSQDEVKRPGYEDILQRRHQGQRDGDAEGCHDLCVDEAFIVRSVAVVDAVQCPADDADDDDRAAELRDAEDDVRDAEAGVLIHVLVFLVQTVEKSLSCVVLEVGNDWKNERYSECSDPSDRCSENGRIIHLL
jgi:hypothetical protein